MVEIERKYLVNGLGYRKEARAHIRIVQAFLSTDPDRTIRVRCTGPHGFLTIKGRTCDKGTTRREWEYEIPLKDAEEMLALCVTPPIEKIRYQVEFGLHTFEVDEFTGLNQGLTLAEVELESADEVIEKPSWLGQEVTGDIRYYNSQLSLKPYTTWND
ncbi:CYTH domain-containing protein [Robiginitalea aurantiaca]|uniref:CYTH domain-containing protein n=1 Tax=Robiginitalea aurantiaca TaxID=3056915 RepID=A0ABT7WE88_9FLAO|nr:CYTH domain-containing protein [Robiginitalea aurantiaca]MDM9631232.1 CYTH domain-containing protein [Robiginitalea aurantiaca]